MTDFSLLDLREFVSVAEQYDDRVRDFSSISLRLALQRICDEMKLKQFSAFLQSYSQSAALRYAVKQRISTHPRELFRDVKVWQAVLETNTALLGNSQAKVLIIDNSFMSETATLFICAAFLKIEVTASIEWINSLGTRSQKRTLHLNRKEFEVAKANVESLGIDLSEYFREEAANFVFDFPSNCSAAELNSQTNMVLPLEQKYALLISQNNSLVLNFAGQDKFFKACYDVTTDR